MRIIILILILISVLYPMKLFSAEITVSADGETKSISEAINRAGSGDRIIVRQGVYKEHIIINKTLKLIGINRPEINGSGEGTIIKVSAPDVTIEGFSIKSSGNSLSREDCAIETDDSPGAIIHNNKLEDVLFGIYIKNSPDTVISKNVIRGKDLPLPDRGDGIRLWYSSGTLVSDNTLLNTRDLVIWWSSNTLIRNNTVKNGRYGLHYMYSNHNRFEKNIFEGNSVGGFLMYSNDIEFYENIFAKNQGMASGYGVGFKDLDDVVAERNVFIDNRVGIYADNSPHSINSWNEIRNNVIAFNDIGTSLMPSIERNLFEGNSFLENYEQVEIRGGGTLDGNKWYKDGSGNFWSNYTGYDANNDGIGDIPFVYESLFETIIDKNPELRLFIYSPASNAIELASEAVPVIKPEPKLTDEYPLVSPNLPDIRSVRKSNNSLSFLIISFAMFIFPLISYIYIKKAGYRN